MVFVRPENVDAMPAMWETFAISYLVMPVAPNMVSARMERVFVHKDGMADIVRYVSIQFSIFNYGNAFTGQTNPFDWQMGQMSMRISSVLSLHCRIGRSVGELGEDLVLCLVSFSNEDIGSERANIVFQRHSNIE